MALYVFLRPSRGLVWRGRQRFLSSERGEIEDAVKHLHAGEYRRTPATLQSLAGALADFGPLTMIGPETLPLAIRPPAIRDGALAATAIRADGADERPVRAAATRRSV